MSQRAPFAGDLHPPAGNIKFFDRRAGLDRRSAGRVREIIVIAVPGLGETGHRLGPGCLDRAGLERHALGREPEIGDLGVRLDLPHLLGIALHEFVVERGPNREQPVFFEVARVLGAGHLGEFRADFLGVGHLVDFVAMDGEVIERLIALDVGEKLVALVALHRAIFVEIGPDLFNLSEEVPRPERIGMAPPVERAAAAAEDRRAFNERDLVA